MRYYIAYSYALNVLSALCLVCTPTFADTAPTEITVGNPLPSELGEDLPGSVAEISPKLLRESGFTSTSSIFDRLPNITWSAGTSRPRFIFVRGIGDLDQYAGSGLPAVTVLSDGFNFSGIANGLSLFDTRLARIERGPTGFFGGPSSLAGLVQFASAGTDFSEDGASIIESSIGSGGVRKIGARTMIGNQDLYGSLTAERNHADGFLRNAFLGRADTNHLDTTSFKGNFTSNWDNGNTFSLNILSTQNDDGYDAFTIDNTRTVRSDKPGADDLGLSGASGHSTLLPATNLRIDLDASTLLAQSTYSYDGDWGNDSFWFPNLPYDYFSITNRNRHLSTGEAKITAGSEVSSMAQLGVYAQRLTESTDQQDQSESVAYRTLSSDFADTRLALHGAVSHHFTDAIRGWIAARLEHQDVAVTERDNGGAKRDSTSTAPLFQIGIENYIDSHTNTFFKASRGWRGGGFNVGAAVPRDRIEFNPEYLTELTLGARHTFENKQNFVEVSLFRAFRNDQQVRLELQTNPNDPLSFVYVTDNAARGDTLGLEAESQVQLSQSFSLHAAAALLKASFSEFDGGRPELSHRDAALAPNWRLNLDARYQISQGWFTRIGVVSTDRYYFDEAVDTQSPSITLLNASFGYEAGNWSVVCWAHNLFDRRYATRGFFFGNEPPDFTPKKYIQRGDPLSGGVTVSYSF